MMKKYFTKDKNSQEDQFWSWFIKHADQYMNFEQNQTALFNMLKQELSKVHPDLVFEFSPIFQDGTREFVISADGLKEVFPSVIKLVDRAPTFKQWKIVAFRQPSIRFTQIKYRSVLLNFEDVFFRYAKDHGKIALELNIRGFEHTPDWTGAVFILLDSAIGEYNTEMGLSSITKKTLNEDETADLFPITDLLKIIEDYRIEFNN